MARIFISYKRNCSDEKIALQVFKALAENHEVFIDQMMPVGTEWAERIEAEISDSDYLITFLSPSAAGSEMVLGEIEIAHRLAKEKNGFPKILPVRLAFKEPFQYPLSAYLNSINWAYWDSEADTLDLIEELKTAITGGDLKIGSKQEKGKIIVKSSTSSLPQPFPSAQPIALEMPEGTMDPQSKFYIKREKD